ncbi:hypothetical protein BDA99DRAFT_539789 [Phascolomyces articulosus]|uniref:Uncharacterized protein n=1 Tax=Phascolomyces articulosus TaxID=60185 RepID=A0AAD5K547_9FUNG|nr:hypothetical protein BDA99DRAFT_539789 [Phascolomyces articulosus]
MVGIFMFSKKRHEKLAAAQANREQPIQESIGERIQRYDSTYDEETYLGHEVWVHCDALKEGPTFSRFDTFCRARSPRSDYAVYMENYSPLEGNDSQQQKSGNRSKRQRTNAVSIDEQAPNYEQIDNTFPWTNLSNGDELRQEFRHYSGKRVLMWRHLSSPKLRSSKTSFTREQKTPWMKLNNITGGAWKFVFSTVFFDAVCTEINVDTGDFTLLKDLSGGEELVQDYANLSDDDQMSLYGICATRIEATRANTITTVAPLLRGARWAKVVNWKKHEDDMSSSYSESECAPNENMDEYVQLVFLGVILALFYEG